MTTSSLFPQTFVHHSLDNQTVSPVAAQRISSRVVITLRQAQTSPEGRVVSSRRGLIFVIVMLPVMLRLV
jgi:hypothetical protein